MSPNGEKRAHPPAERLLAAQTRAIELAADTLRRTVLLDDRLRDMAEVEVGTTPSEVVYTENNLELERYKSKTEDQHEVPLLIVYALINQPFILDLQRDRSVVQRLLEAGHDVYIINWNEPSRLDQHLTLADYIQRYIDNVVDHIRDHSGQDAINLLGYCMGGTMSAIYAALNPEKVNALGLMAPPLYLDETGGVLERWGDERYFDPRPLTDTYGNVPGEFLGGGFSAMDPVTTSISKYIALWERLENEDFVENFARMERWLTDGVDLAGEAYAEFIEEIYQQNSLYTGDLTVGSERVDPANIDMPVLQILGEYDNLVPPAASRPFTDVVGSDRVTTIEYPTGHVGMAVSRSTHSHVWPEVAEWFLEHSGRPTRADILGEAIEQALGVDVETDVTVGNVTEVEIAIADRTREIARELVERDAGSIARFFEDVLDVDIDIHVRDTDVVVDIVTGEGIQTTVVERVGEAIRGEIREGIEDTDLAAGYELEDVTGIGPTYGGRLREAGIETVPGLAIADPKDVAASIDAPLAVAEKLIERAQALSGVSEH